MTTTTPTSGDFFDGFADTFDTFYDGKRNPVMQKIDERFRNDMFERYRLTYQRLGDMTGKTVIDIGCGSGPYVVEALSRGASRVLALDAAPRMLELTRSRVAKIGATDRVDYQESYFPPNSPVGPFDLAIVMGVLDYVEDSEDFMRELRTTVTGAAVISFPSKHWLRTPIRKVRYKIRKCPLWFYDEAQIARNAKAAGWSSVEIRKIGGAGMDYHVCLKP